MENTAKKTKDEVMNGVNVTQLGENIAAIKEKPELAEFQFRAVNDWEDGAVNKFSFQDYFGLCQEQETRSQPFTFTADEPPMLLGKDSGANPVEYLLGSLSACMTTALVYHAAAEGIEIESVRSEHEGDIDLNGFLGINPEVRKGFNEIRVNFKVKSDADQAKLEELARRSPTFDALMNPTPIKVTVTKE